MALAPGSERLEFSSGRLLQDISVSSRCLKFASWKVGDFGGLFV